MYISPELFGACNPTTNTSIVLDHRGDSASPMAISLPAKVMPAFTLLGKRKRRADVAANARWNASSCASKRCSEVSSGSTTDNSSPASLAALKDGYLRDAELLVMTVSRRCEVSSDAAAFTKPAPYTTEVAGEPRFKLRRKLLPPRPHRSVLLESHQTNSMSLSPSIPATTNASLEPCHVCKISPKFKSDLAAYGDCDSCQRRTCLICTRTCHGRCGRLAVCSACCEEKGEDGNTWCFACSLREQDHDMHG